MKLGKTLSTELFLSLVSLATVLTLPAQTSGPSPTSGILRIGIVGDQYGSVGDPDPLQILEKGLALLKEKNVQMILHTGDLIEGIGQTQTEYDVRFARMTAILDKVRIPWYLTPGDHDVNPKDFTPNSSDRSVEKLFFANYRLKRPELTPTLNYSFDFDHYHFIALNSLEHLRTDVRWGNAFLAKLSDEQFTWLQQDLTKHRNSRGIVVFTHQPLWYNVGAWQAVHKLLRRYAVRAVVSGHLHYAQDEGELDGIRYLVVGATGGKVKQGSPEAGNAQVVTVMSLGRKKLDVEILPIGSDSPHLFSSRLDMDRIQALDQAMDDLSGWQWEPANALCLQDGKLVMKNDNSPAVIRLRAVGNPIDIPVRLEIRVEASGLAFTAGRFAAGICQQGPGNGCVIVPGATTTISNISTVEFRWPSSTEAPNEQKILPLAPLWEAMLPSTGLSLTAGSTLHVRVKYSFPVDTGTKYVEQDLSMIVNSCSGTSPLR